MACKCGGTVHVGCDPTWPSNLTDDELLHTYEATIQHNVTSGFGPRLADEMKRRGLSSRRWIVDDDDD